MINNGYSGSKLELIKKNNILIVKKTNNIKRNLERYNSLKYLNFNFFERKKFKKNLFFY